MRVDPVGVEIVRTPAEDDVLPLTKPIVGTSGRVYTELPIPKGTPITISTIGYNWYILFTPLPLGRWAHVIVLMAGTRICGVRTPINSDQSGGLRWTNKLNRPLDRTGTCTVTYGVPTEPLSIDIICLAPRSLAVLGAVLDGDSRESNPFISFTPSRDSEHRPLGSVIEIQAFLVTLLQKFDISHADHQPQIRRAKPGMLVPLVLGEEHKGTQLPLKITAIRNT